VPVTMGTNHEETFTVPSTGISFVAQSTEGVLMRLPGPMSLLITFTQALPLHTDIIRTESNQEIDHLQCIIVQTVTTSSLSLYL
jgi:hypothetical protein